MFPPGHGTPIDLLWDEPGFVRFAKRLRGFSRAIWRESGGIGASGGHVLDGFIEGVSDRELTVLLDPVGCQQVVLVGIGVGGATSIRYATSHPERVKAWGFSPDALEQYIAVRRDEWGSGAALEIVAPTKAGDEAFSSWFARSQRLGVRPDQMADALRAAFRLDVRALLPKLVVPTLVLHRTGDRFIEVGAGWYVGEHIPGAKYVELLGDDHLVFVGDADALLDEVEEFLTGTHQAPEGDVVTTSVLFTGIVSSTDQSAHMGHRKWTALTDAHDAMVRATLARHRGLEIKTIGDGFLATFDATRAVRAALGIVTGAKNMGLEVRAGVHIGEVEVRPDDVVGLTVSIAKRVCDLAVPAQLLVSEVVRGLLVGSGIATSDHGTHVLKGVPERWRLFNVDS